jgi:hypothetical protein
MKKQISAILMMVLLFAVSTAYAQAPLGFNYQAVIRDGSGNLITTGTVNMRFTVLQGSSSGTSVYQETQSVAPNSYGLVNLVIGSGNVVSGSFSGIGWGTSTYYLKVEADPTGGTTFVALGNPTEFQSVPYALNAANGYWIKTDSVIYNTNTGGVGIGTIVPNASLDIETNTHFNGIISNDSTNNANGIIAEANIGTFAYGILGESSSGYAGYFSGNVTYTGTLAGPSDRRLKENVQPLTNAVSRLQQLVPSSYTFKKEYSKMNLPKGTQFGFIAQDMEKVFPELVVTNYDKQLNKGSVFEYKGINYIGMVPVLTQAINEQQQQIQSQQQQIQNQQKQIDELKALVQKLTTK